MDGHYSTDKNGVGNLYIDVINIEEFNELLSKVQEQANQLQKTINELSIFQLKIEFKTRE